VGEGLAVPQRKSLVFQAKLKDLEKRKTTNYLIMRGGSLKKIEKKIIPSVPTNKNV